jgi:hypothetical protein
MSIQRKQTPAKIEIAVENLSAIASNVEATDAKKQLIALSFRSSINWKKFSFEAIEISPPFLKLLYKK